MPIPHFTSDGLLPLGIHDCDINEAESVFCCNDHRRAVWTGFLELFGLLKSVPEIECIYLDGGFVTTNEHPKDVDIVIQYPDVPTLTAVVASFPFLAERDRLKSRYKVDVLFGFPTKLPGYNDLREFFQYLRPEDAAKKGLPPGTKKGILRVALHP